MSKPKKKHEKMRDKIDFKKIIHKGSLIGVLNFNLMLPVENAQIQRIDTQIRKHDNMDTRKKKELLIKELQWCNEHISDLAIVNDIKNFVFGLAGAFVYGFCKSRKQKFVMSFTIILQMFFIKNILQEKILLPENNAWILREWSWSLKIIIQNKERHKINLSLKTLANF